MDKVQTSQCLKYFLNKHESYVTALLFFARDSKGTSEVRMALEYNKTIKVKKLCFVWL